MPTLSAPRLASLPAPTVINGYPVIASKPATISPRETCYVVVCYRDAAPEGDYVVWYWNAECPGAFRGSYDLSYSEAMALFAMPSPTDILYTLPDYGDWRPTSFDSRGIGLPDRQTWKVLPVTQTRDSGPLARSNFRTALASLASADPNGDGHEVHRFGHWGPGWIEVILIDPDGPAAPEAAEIAASLDAYPILSEEDHSELEWSEAAEAWRNMGTRDRIRACARYRVSIFAARRDDVPDDAGGELIGYLAGEG